jgi:hypothetical protein
MDEFLAANRLNWDDRAALHATDPTGMYGIACGSQAAIAFTPSKPPRLAKSPESGSSTSIGTDTISLAHRGATVTGLDFSAVALDAARSLAQRAGRGVRFDSFWALPRSPAMRCLFLV